MHFDDERKLEKIIELLEEGHYANTVCAVVGITEACYYGWLKRGKEEGPGSPYYDFLVRVQAASREAEVRALRKLEQHWEDNYGAVLAFLSRRYPENWRERKETKLTGDSREPIVFDNSRDTIKELLDILIEAGVIPDDEEE